MRTNAVPTGTFEVRKRHFDPIPPAVLHHTCPEAMPTDLISMGLPIPEQALKDLSKNILGIIPRFSEQEHDSGVK